MLREFFSLPQEIKQQFCAPESHGQTGYTGLLVETAASSDVPDWKEMLNWGRSLPVGHPLRERYPHRYGPQVLPESAVPGIEKVLTTFHDSIEDLQRRFLRVIAEAIGCDAHFFDEMTHNGATLTRAIRYPPMVESPGGTHVWAGSHGDINLITALPRATAPGLQVLVGDDWVDAVAPDGQVIINTGMMLERLTNGLIPHRHPPRGRQCRVHRRALQRRAVLPPDAVDLAQPAGQLHLPGAPTALLRHGQRRRARPRAVRDQPRRERPPCRVRSPSSSTSAPRRWPSG